MAAVQPPLRTGARVVVTYGERSTSVYTGVIAELRDDEALIKWDGTSPNINFERWLAFCNRFHLLGTWAAPTGTVSHADWHAE